MRGKAADLILSLAAGTSLSGHSHPYARNVAPISGTHYISFTEGAQIPIHTAATASTCSSPSELEAFFRSGNYMRDADEEFAQYVRIKAKTVLSRWLSFLDYA